MQETTGLWQKAVRSACRLYPADFRRKLADDLAAVFEEQYSRRRRDKTRTAAWIYGFQTVAGIVREALRARYGRGVRRGTTGPWLTPRGDGGMREQLNGWVREAKPVLRGLLKSPGYTIVAVLTLAIGIGGSVAVFTVLDRVVLDPLAYPEADRLVHLRNQVPGVGPDTEWHMASAQYFYYKENAASIEEIGAFRHTGTNLQTPAGPQRARLAIVSASTLGMIGARAVLGRMIDAADDRPGEPRVAVLSHEFWTRQFGSDRNIIGQTISMNDLPYDVVGIMAAGVNLPAEPGAPSGSVPDAWIPMRLNPAGPFHNNHVIPMIARLRPGVGLEEAQGELERLTALLPEAFPTVYTQGFIDRYGFRPIAYPLKEYVVGDVARNLWILFGAVGLVLLVACAKVTNLFLVRMEDRRHELAIRSALGAGRFAVARAILAESLALSVTGGLLGLLLGFWGLSALISLAPITIPRLHGLGLDGGAILVTTIVSGLVGFGIAAFPIAHHVGSGEAATLSAGGRSASVGRERQRLRSGLVVAQVALALTLVVGAGVLIASLRRLQGVHPGIQPEGVLTMQLHLTDERYQSTVAMWRFYAQALERIRALPGVQEAGMSSEIPFSGDYGCTVQGFEDRLVYERLRDAGMTTCAGQEPTTPGYFKTMGIPVLQGRVFTDADNDHPDRGVVVVNKAFADRFWPGEDPLGKGIAPSGRTNGPFYRVVGVVGDVYRSSLGGEPATAVYYPIVWIPGSGGWWPSYMTLIVRTGNADPMSVFAAIRQAVQEVDPTVPLANAREMESIIDDSMSRLSFTALLLDLAAAVALLLAAVGLYGVMSYVVSRRTREIGMRMALGARPDQVVRLIVGKSLALVAMGLGLGVFMALALTRVMRGLLFGVEPTHPAAFVTAISLLGAVALVASWLPARRAARIDPAVALRME